MAGAVGRLFQNRTAEPPHRSDEGAIMLEAFIGDITGGRLGRLQFLGYWILLAIIVIVIGLGIGAAVGAAEQMVGGDLQSAQVKLREALGVPALLLISVVFALLLFIGANLKAKRIRDVGLPVWSSAPGTWSLGSESPISPGPRWRPCGGPSMPT
jgi:hypothetical protein